MADSSPCPAASIIIKPAPNARPLFHASPTERAAFLDDFYTRFVTLLQTLDAEQRVSCEATEGVAS